MLQVSLRAHAGYKINREAPLEVRVESGTLDHAVRRDSLQDASAQTAGAVTMEIPFTPASPGEHPMEVHAHFGLCGELDCAMCQEQRRVTAHVH